MKIAAKLAKFLGFAQLDELEAERELAVGRLRKLSQAVRRDSDPRLARVPAVKRRNGTANPDILAK